MIMTPWILIQWCVAILIGIFTLFMVALACYAVCKWTILFFRGDKK